MVLGIGGEGLWISICGVSGFRLDLLWLLGFWFDVGFLGCSWGFSDFLSWDAGFLLSFVFFVLLIVHGAQGF